MSTLSNNRSIYNSGLALGLLLLTVLSCGGDGGQQPVQHFALTIALSEPLGDAGSPLPDDIKAMLKPFQAKNCSSFLFVPDVTIVRLDVSDAKPEVLDLGKDQNEVERRLGKALTPEKARSVRDKALAVQRISSLMSQAKGADATTIENLRKLLASAANQYVFTTEETKQALGNALNVNKVITARDLNDLLSRVGSTFCAKTSEKPTPMASLIVYRSGDIVTEPPVAVNKTPASPSPAPVGPLSRDDANALFTQLSAEAQQALADPEKKRAVHAKLAKAQAEASWDYRFTYERAKLAVYGTKSHDEAFYHLCRAAEIAVENGDADKMLQALQNDSGEDQPFHRLSHGDHPQWPQILNALRTKDASVVRKCS